MSKEHPMQSDQLLRATEYRNAGYWGDDTLTTVIDRWADNDPDRPYVSDGTHTLTYGQFRQQAVSLATHLAANGVELGDRVAVQLPNWAEFLLAYAACDRLGAITIPIVPVYRANEVQFIVDNSGAKILITCGEFRGFDHAAMAAQVVAVADHSVAHIVARKQTPSGALDFADLLSDTTASPPTVTPNADAAHLVLYSSGTESRPKGCVHTWNTASFLPKQAIPAMGLTRDDTMFMPSPVTHALGLTLGVMAPTLAGAAIHLLDVFEPRTALDRIRSKRCTGTASPSPFIRMLLDAYDPESHDVSTLRFWFTAGAPIPQSLVEEAASRLPNCRVVSAYGSSEVMMATVCRPDDPLERVAATDGAPVPGVELRIVADTGTAQTGVEGEIRYRGPGRMIEYWNRRDLTTAGLDEDGWWCTGDIGRLDEHGYLRVTGRLKDIIIRGGFNISAREIEEALLAMPAITNVSVIGLPDPIVGERVCAVIEVNALHAAPTREEIRHYLTNERGMAVWKVPEQIETVTQWPTTATGKIQKFKLRDAVIARLGDD
jgi:cyclohexanecarboxylate-CoA ligase/acyl-CoA synthetase